MRRSFWCLSLIVSILALPALARADDTPLCVTFQDGKGSDSPAAPPIIRLDGKVWVHVRNRDTVEPKKARLRIGDYVYGDDPVWLQDTHLLVFTLSRAGSDQTTDAAKANRKMWSSLLGSPTEANSDIDIGLIYDGKGADIVSGDNEKDIKTLPIQKAKLVRFCWVGMIIGAAAVIVVGVCLLLLGAKTSIFRDTMIVPQIPPMECTYSLGRCQMAAWTFTVLASFLFLYILLEDYNSLNDQALILLGISAGTALWAVAIDRSKDDFPAQVQSRLCGIGLKELGDVEVLEINKAVPTSARAAIVGAMLPNNAAPTFVQLWAAYQSETAYFRTKGFWRDLVDDMTGPTLHRVQMLVWTLIAIAIYLFQVFSRLEMPEFDKNLLALIGISNGIYVGFKWAMLPKTTS